GTTVYRHTQTDYELNSEYVNRYIIGLVKEARLYDGVGTSNLQSKTSYGYDEETITDLTGIIQHQTSNYGASFQWRGNQTNAKRWNIDPADPIQSTLKRAGYNIAGQIAWTQDPVQDASHRIQVSYVDNFSDGVNRNTYAYPTTVTDPQGFTVTSKYQFYSGLI